MIPLFKKFKQVLSAILNPQANDKKVKADNKVKTNKKVRKPKIGTASYRTERELYSAIRNGVHGEEQSFIVTHPSNNRFLPKFKFPKLPNIFNRNSEFSEESTVTEEFSISDLSETYERPQGILKTEGSSKPKEHKRVRFTKEAIDKSKRDFNPT